MLPSSFLARITSVAQPKSFGSHTENRSAVRVPVNVKCDALCIDRDRIGNVVAARLKDISASGVGMLVSIKSAVTEEFILGLCPKGLDTHWLLCRTRRTSNFDGICTIVGATWEKILIPGQDLQPGLKMATLSWLDTDGTSISQDPFLQLPSPTTPQPTAAPQA